MSEKATTPVIPGGAGDGTGSGTATGTDPAAKDGGPATGGAAAGGPVSRLLTSRAGRWATAAVAAALLVSAPFQFAPFRVFQLTMVLVYAIALLGLNLLVGHAGQISLGHGAFFAVGAYTAAILIDKVDFFAGAHLLTLPIAAVVTFLIGIALGVPVLRLRGLYLALVTLSIAVFTVPLLKRMESLTGGSMGLTLPKPSAPAWSGLADDQWLYFLSLVIAVVFFAVGRSLLRSRVGRALHALRDNEAAAETMGVRLPFYKTLAFGWSAMYAGAAGAVYTWTIGFVSPDSFTLNLSIILLAGLVVGGLGSFSGPIWGAVFVVYVPSLAQDLNKAAPGMVFGILIIAVMYVAPTGLAGLAGRGVRSIGRHL